MMARKFYDGALFGLVVALALAVLLLAQTSYQQGQEIKQLQARPCFEYTPGVPYPWHPVPCNSPEYLGK
jgi:hypothetical protein